MRDANMYLQCENDVIMTKHGTAITKPAIIIDRETGTLLKYGNLSEELVAYLMNGHLANLPVQLVRFDTDTYTNDDICTIINYALNCHGEKLLEFLKLNQLSEIQKVLEKWKSFGY